VARRATVIKQERSRADYLLLLDAGNAWLNDRNPAKLSRGKSSVEVMNKLGYDAMALGLQDLILKPKEVAQRIKEARFSVLSANAYWKGGVELVGLPYVIFEMGGHRVGVLGLTAQGVREGFEIVSPTGAARAWLPKLQRKADIVVVLSNAGPEVDRELLHRFQGIDILISGAGQRLLQPEAVPSGALLFSADVSRPGFAGERVGVAQLSFDREGKLIGYSWRRVVITPEFAADPEIKAWVESVKGKVDW